MHLANATPELSAPGAQASDPVLALTAVATKSAVGPLRARILCCGRDPVLNRTRSAILRRHYDPSVLHSLSELAALVATAQFELILLCHTLSPDERQRLLETAHQVWPKAKVIYVASGRNPTQPGVDRVVPGMAGPEALLAAVLQVLRPTLSAGALR